MYGLLDCFFVESFSVAKEPSRVVSTREPNRLTLIFKFDAVVAHVTNIVFVINGFCLASSSVNFMVTNAGENSQFGFQFLKIGKCGAQLAVVVCDITGENNEVRVVALDSRGYFFKLVGVDMQT